jgi:outer membrane receptor protein involved in Fe transport
MYRTTNTTNSVSLYWNNMSNMIYAPLGIEINPDFMYHNIGKNISKGIEFENKSVLSKHLYLFMNASYTVSKNMVAINDNDSIYNYRDVAPFKFNFGVNFWFLKHFNCNLISYYRSKMEKFLVFDQATGTNVEVQDPIGNYAIFNFTVRAKELIKNIEFSLSVYNFLNTKYYSQDNEHLHQPPQQGRQLIFNLSYAF